MIKAVKKLKKDQIYYAIGKKDLMNVNTCVKVLNISKDDCLCKTQRNDIPDHHNTTLSLPLDTIKFYKMKDRMDYKVMTALQSKINKG